MQVVLEKLLVAQCPRGTLPRVEVRRNLLADDRTYGAPVLP